jgi:hypothetical protein
MKTDSNTQYVAEKKEVPYTCYKFRPCSAFFRVRISNTTQKLHTFSSPIYSNAPSNPSITVDAKFYTRDSSMYSSVLKHFLQEHVNNSRVKMAAANAMPNHGAIKDDQHAGVSRLAVHIMYGHYFNWQKKIPWHFLWELRLSHEHHTSIDSPHASKGVAAEVAKGSCHLK